MFKRNTFIISNIIIILLFFLEGQCLLGENKTSEKVEYYKIRYKKTCLDDKIVDNYGNGFKELYGTRNMKPVLHGFVYRGGANNYYHKKNKRKNRNPLPKDGFLNLAKEGFSSVVYLYGKNWESTKSYRRKVTGKDTLVYIKNTLSNSDQDKELLRLVYNTIKYAKGPMYLHCWNGWHQSGYASAIILRQFCGYSGKKAVQYWNECADGAGKGYENIKERIRKFKPYPEFKLSSEITNKFCLDCL